MEIIQEWMERQKFMSPMFQRMGEIQKLNNGELVLPLPEVDKVEKAAVANLIQQGIDQLGSRIASVRPDVDCPSISPGNTRADQRAYKRRQAILGWWDHSMVDILDGQRARHLIAYASSPCIIRPGHSHQQGVPTWHLRSPLQTYPAARPNPTDMEPDNCIFTYPVTLGFLQKRYPDQIAGLEKGERPHKDDRYDILEYVDADEFSMFVVGKSAARNQYGTQLQVGAPYATIYRNPNRAGVCPVVIPKRTSLDIPMGKFDGMTGMYTAQARLMALSLIAVQRSVFMKEWLVGRPGEMPEVLTEADPENGRTGVVVGGVLQPSPMQPPSAALAMVQDLAQEQRQQGGLPQEFGGESPTNVRTGRRGADVLSAAIDFPIQEAQLITARAKEHENEIAIAIDKAYFGDKMVSFYIRKMKGERGRVSYTPNDIFETDVNFVDYPSAGSDVNQLTVQLGQLWSLKAMSVDTGRKLHPMIDDPDHEREMVIAESLQEALLGSIAQAVQAGQIGPVDISKITTILEEEHNVTLAQAIQRVHQEEQQRQAQPPASPAELTPGIAGPPGAPAGAAVPPGGPPTPGPPTPSVENLAQLLGQLHSPQANAA
jgi:hypothetical protein